MSTHHLKLNDGRILAYALYGLPGGKPVLYLHGTPSSRLEPLFYNIYGKQIEELLKQLHLQLIAFDRAGMGESDYDANKTFTSVAVDGAQLLQHLQIRQYSILCWSGGGPYALALAALYPHSVRSVHIIAGFTLSFGEKEIFREMHRNRYYFATARRLPGLLKIVLSYLNKKRVTRPLSKKLTGLADTDIALMKDPKKHEQLAQLTIKEACRRQNRGAVQEAALYFQPFGFRLQDISCELHYWWGREDKAVTQSHPAAIEDNIRHAKMHYYEDEGHLSVYVNHMEEVLKTLSR